MTRARPKLPASGDEDDFIGTPFELFVDIGEERVEAAAVADQPGERLAGDRLSVHI